MIQKQTVYLPIKVEDDATFLITKEISNYLNYNCSINFYEDGRRVYTPCFITQTTKELEEFEHLIIERLDRKKAFVFTSEQLNEYTKTVIKQSLETAADKALLSIDGILEKNNGQRYIVEEGNHYCETEIDVSKESITNTFEETYNKLKV